MKNLLTLFCFLLLNLTYVFAEPSRIVVLTTVNDQEGKHFWNTQSYTLNKKIEDYFEKYSEGESRDYFFIHNASSVDVYRELTNPENTAIYFVGHGGFIDTKSTALQSSAIFDSQSVQIQNLFTAINPSIHYLAVISCNSEGILSKVFSRAKLTIPPSLTLKTFDKKISLKSGIRDALKLRKSALSDMDRSPVDRTSGTFKIRLKRSKNGEDTTSFVLINNRVKGIFKEDQEELEIEVSYNDFFRTKKISITNDSGRDHLGTSSLGELILSDDDNMNCELAPELSKNGKLLGITKNYYKLLCKGSNGSSDNLLF